MIRRTVTLVAATLVCVGTLGAVAAPAFAMPQQVCVVTSPDPDGRRVNEFCVRI
ncbi:MAG: hypothetical protein ABR520_13085 [Mycobacteriales bacterium]|nr:hypothetical protein [Frankia sp.]